jgi:hypothetical protein
MAHLIRTDRGATDIWAALHDCLGNVPLSGSHFSSLGLYSPETNDAAFYENMLHLCSSLKTVEVCSQLRSYGDVKVVKTGPQSYIARFPRLDDRVSSLAEVIDDIPGLRKTRQLSQTVVLVKMHPRSRKNEVQHAHSH